MWLWSQAAAKGGGVTAVAEETPGDETSQHPPPAATTGAVKQWGSASLDVARERGGRLAFHPRCACLFRTFRSRFAFNFFTFRSKLRRRCAFIIIVRRARSLCRVERLLDDTEAARRERRETAAYVVPCVGGGRGRGRGYSECRTTSDNRWVREKCNDATTSFLRSKLAWGVGRAWRAAAAGRATPPGAAASTASADRDRSPARRSRTKTCR